MLKSFYPALLLQFACLVIQLTLELYRRYPACHNLRGSHWEISFQSSRVYVNPRGFF
jgi:hypothetical protein